MIEALKSWPSEGFHLQHITSLHALTQIELYTGDVKVAWKHVEGQWPALEDSLLLRTPAVRVEAMQLRARTALATSGEGSSEGRDIGKLRLAEKMARKMEKVNMSWSKPFAKLVRAAVAQQRGQAAQATALLSEAEQIFERADMHLYAAATRRAAGKTWRRTGPTTNCRSYAWMMEQKIKVPEAMTRMLAPDSKRGGLP